MRIAMLAPRPSVRGPLPKHTPILVDALRSLGCDVELLPWGRRVEGERLPAKLLSRARDVSFVRRTVVGREFPVVVVKTAHDWLTLIRDLALVSALPRRTVVVLQFHGSQSARLVAPGSWAFKRATAALLSRVDGILVLSQEERAQWQSFKPGLQVAVVRNPSPGSAAAVVSRGSGDRTRTILCVARLIRSKGVLELVRVLPLLRDTIACRLVIAGDGTEKDNLRALAEELGVSDVVELPGYVEGAELAGLYQSADVFALPTAHDEGFPTVLLEAMAAGLPIVTTPSRGARDHLVSDEHALFVPPHDVDSLAEAIRRLLVDDALARRMSDANREKVREFDADHVAQEYLDALDAIVCGAVTAS